ncbi:MAG: hypothetical protein WA869_31615 [Alloacidobacterium sp.]
MRATRRLDQLRQAQKATVGLSGGAATRSFQVFPTTERAVQQREAEHKGEETIPYWTSWMDQVGYQQEFDRRVKNGWYPSQIEAAN